MDSDRSCGSGKTPAKIVMAGNFGAEYTTEWQTDFRQGVNWVNLLHLSYSSPTFLGMQLNAASVSIAQTREEAFMHDLQASQTLKKKTCLLP